MLLQEVHRAAVLLLYCLALCCYTLPSPFLFLASQRYMGDWAKLVTGDKSSVQLLRQVWVLPSVIVGFI